MKHKRWHKHTTALTTIKQKEKMHSIVLFAITHYVHWIKNLNQNFDYLLRNIVEWNLHLNRFVLNLDLDMPSWNKRIIKIRIWVNRWQRGNIKVWFTRFYLVLVLRATKMTINLFYFLHEITMNQEGHTQSLNNWDAKKKSF